MKNSGANTPTSKHIIAHRGAWKKMGLPENSMASLRQAIKLRCYGSEFDVHMTADSVLVINHDPEFKGMKIETSSYKELLQKQHDNGEFIPTLEAYLKEGMKQRKTKLILEIKASVINKDRTIALTQCIMNLVEERKAQKWMEYISFDKDACKKVMEIDDKAKISYLKGDESPEELYAAGFSGLDYHYSVFQKHPDWINAAHKLGLVINAWTVNEKSIADWLLKNDADYITTNEPEILMKSKKTHPLSGSKFSSDF